MKYSLNKDQIIKNFLPKIKIIALNLLSTLPKSVEVDDLIQEGLIGLLQAYDRYDPSMGANFYTYGMNRIRGAMLDYLRRIDWLPKELRHLIKGYENFMADNPDKHFTDEEIMDNLKISHDDFEKLKFSVRKSQILELDAYLTDKSYEEGMERAIADDADDPEVNAYKEILNEKLKEAVEELSEKDQLILSLYYEKGLTFREIGEVIGVSESRISQIHTAIIVRLKRSLKGDE